jgi:putative salt-induced outer membrane protein YdiY
MFYRFFLALIVYLALFPNPTLFASVLGQITMKDGSIIHGDIIQMVDGQIKVKAPYGAGEPFLIQWAEVVSLATSQSTNFVLFDGTSIQGTAEKGEPGELRLTAKPLARFIVIPLASVSAISPPKKKHVKYNANLDFGGKFSEGNTVNKQANFLSKFEARSKRLRVRLEGRYFYAEDDGDITDRNAFGTMQLDYFFLPRIYWYVSILFEQDTFDDLDLRTAPTTGPGYQFVERGDFSHKNFKDMELSGEIGAGNINEDRKIAEDDNFGVFRWAANWNWQPIKGINVFHRHQGFPEISDLNNYYINTIQGVRFEIWNGFNLAVQVNYKYDNDPGADTKKSDTKGLITLGYGYIN